MGSFSWMKADRLSETSNIVCGESFKCLIPQEFGGGFIEDEYQDYGRLGTKDDGSVKYDMYELLAFWNHEMLENMRRKLAYEGEFPNLKEMDDHTVHNRGLGIGISRDDDDVDKLKYPLKLVSIWYEGSYEQCYGRSYDDPNQGFCETYWDDEENA